MQYYAVHRSPNDELTHWKYISKKKVKGKWRYVYDKESAKKKSKNKLVNTFNKTVAKGEKWVYNKFLKNKTAKKPSKSKFSKWVSKGKKKVDKLFFEKYRKKKEKEKKKKRQAEIQKKIGIALDKLKQHKYIKKVKMPNGKTRYFYDQDEYAAYQKRLKYQTDEPDFMKKVKKLDKNTVMSADDDMAATNPKYDRFDDDYSLNCFRCSIAYELRRRGYDVTASKQNSFDQSMDSTGKAFKNPKTVFIKGDGSVKDTLPGSNRYGVGVIPYAASAILNSNQSYGGKTVKNALEQNNSPNSRGIFSVTWKESFGGGRHSMVYEIDSKGNATIRDAQTNRVENIGSVASMVSSISYTRTDNLTLKKGVLDYIER